jgi:hypothetical protein
LTIYAIFHTGLVAGADMIELAKRAKKRKNRLRNKAAKKAKQQIPICDGFAPRPGIIAPHTTVSPRDMISDSTNIAIPASKNTLANPAPKLIKIKPLHETSDSNNLATQKDDRRNESLEVSKRPLKPFKPANMKNIKANIKLVSFTLGHD